MNSYRGEFVSLIGQNLQTWPKISLRLAFLRSRKPTHMHLSSFSRQELCYLTIRYYVATKKILPLIS